MGHRLELDDDLRRASRHAFAGAQVKGHAGPAPIVDLGLHGDEGLGVAVVVHVFFEVVRRHFLTTDASGAILAAHGLVLHVLAGNGLEGTQNLHFLVPHGFGLELRRRLHGHQAQQLQQVVLQHVAGRAGAVIVASAVLYTQGFADADLHVVDLAVAPYRLQQGVGEAQGHQVLHGLLAQVVVDTEHLGFLEHRTNCLVDGGGGCQ
ncbi:hypothetical protein D3C81_1328430 [compost metagenome]